jgi:putative oxygen-independent coproporphyrinogen III oxidase
MANESHNLNAKTNNAKTRIGIYIHWPYCSQICPYCDFNIYRARGRDNDGLLAAIKTQILNYYNQTQGRKLSSLYFGGGTPSLIDASEIAALIDLCDKLWGFETNPEIVLEANPNEIEKFQDIKSAGIERLSLGVQSFLDTGLKDLGRFHNAQDAQNAAIHAREVFERVSLDLIYARQNQSFEDWEFELKQAIEIGIDHISPYQLTIEPNTSFDRKVARGTIKMPEDEKSAQFYEMTQDVLAQNGFIGYEISNHAKDEKAISRHNLLYWQSQDWIGIGPGAHGRIWKNEKRHALLNYLKPDEFIAKINENGLALIEDEILDFEEIRQEYFLMGLRLKEGIEYNGEYNLDYGQIQNFKELGYIDYDAKKVRLLEKGRTISNYIIGKLIG